MCENINIPKEIQNLFLESVIANTSEGIVVTDENHIMVYANPAMSQITGYSESEIIGRKPNIFASNKHDTSFFVEMIRDVETHGFWKGNVWDRRKNGEIFLLELTLERITAENKRWNVAIYNDLSSAEKFYKNLSNFDLLTNLPNRFLFKDRLQFMVAHAKRNDLLFAVLMLDLNRFKIMNDTLGSNVGDAILIKTAERLQRAIRETDSVFRLGNDEFVIIAEDIGSANDATLIAQKVLHVFNTPFKIPEYKEELFLSASLGISVYPQDGNTATDMTKNAETAMYKAKAMEQNNFKHYSPSMNARLLEHLTMEHQLYKAIENEEFVVYYQPFVDLRADSIIGAEALVRWVHPELGIVSPAEFIPIAEETGLIVPIGDYVLNRACFQANEWIKSGYDQFKISVNLSGRQFKQNDLVEKIEIVLMQTGLPPSLLDLEITESICMENADASVDILSQIKKHGINLLIDDFGTGYSSLSYLKKFPINVLKIDQSFVRDITEDRDSETIVSLIISMAHTLNLKVIAEGVETEEHLNFLNKNGCDMCQGYLYSRPVPAEEFLLLLKEGYKL